MNDNQLKQLSLQNIMGKDGKSEEFPKNLQDAMQANWSDFLDHVIDHLEESDVDELQKMISDESLRPEDFLAFFKRVLPDFDELYEEFTLMKKAEIVEGRILELRDEVAGDERLLEKLDQADKYLEEEQWSKIEEILMTDFSNY